LLKSWFQFATLACLARLIFVEKADGVAKSPPCDVRAFFQDIDTCQMVAFVPEKLPSLAEQNLCLAFP
jgi:hypothetical protein